MEAVQQRVERVAEERGAALRQSIDKVGPRPRPCPCLQTLFQTAAQTLPASQRLRGQAQREAEGIRPLFPTQYFTYICCILCGWLQGRAQREAEGISPSALLKLRVDSKGQVRARDVRGFAD